jgi:hypothetical protein
VYIFIGKYMEKPKIYLETTMFSFYYGQETFGGIGVMKTVEDYMNDPPYNRRSGAYVRPGGDTDNPCNPAQAA